MKKNFGIAKFVVSVLVGAAVGGAATTILKDKAIDSEKKRVDKFKDYYNLLNQWLILKHEGKCLDKYFVDNGYHVIAIYGMGEMGNRLYEELKNSGIKIKYAIDENESNFSELKLISPNDEFEEVDVIVVSAIFAFDEIVGKIEDKVKCPVISLEDVVFTCK